MKVKVTGLIRSLPAIVFLKSNLLTIYSQFCILFWKLCWCSIKITKMVVTCAVFSIRKDMDPFWFCFVSLEIFMLGEYAISENEMFLKLAGIIWNTYIMYSVILLKVSYIVLFLFWSKVILEQKWGGNLFSHLKAFGGALRFVWF